MKIDKSIVVDFPEWAITLLEYGDESGVTREDAKLFNDWHADMIMDGYTSHEVTDCHNEFCANPAFGEATATVRVRFIKWRRKVIKATRKMMRSWGAVIPGYPLGRGEALIRDGEVEKVKANAKADGFDVEPLRCVGHDYNYGGELFAFTKDGGFV